MNAYDGKVIVIVFCAGIFGGVFLCFCIRLAAAVIATWLRAAADKLYEIEKRAFQNSLPKRDLNHEDL